MRDAKGDEGEDGLFFAILFNDLFQVLQISRCGLQANGFRKVEVT